MWSEEEKKCIPIIPFIDVQKYIIQAQICNFLPVLKQSDHAK